MIWNSHSIDWGHKQYGNWISIRGKWTFPLMKHSPKIIWFTNNLLIKFSFLLQLQQQEQKGQKYFAKQDSTCAFSNTIA